MGDLQRAANTDTLVLGPRIQTFLLEYIDFPPLFERYIFLHNLTGRRKVKQGTGSFSVNLARRSCQTPWRDDAGDAICRLRQGFRVPLAPPLERPGEKIGGSFEELERG